MARDYLTVNRDIWNADAPNWVDLATDLWPRETPAWGTWGNAEAEVAMLPEDMTGMHAVEFGCGTG